MPKTSDKRRLLLISNSTEYGRGYLDHVEAELRDFLGNARRVLFVPYALHDRDDCAGRARERLEQMGFQLESLHVVENKPAAVGTADAVFVGGGNTFRLLKALYDDDLLGAIRQRVREGMPYVGSSAGSIVAGPSIKTTKDMPIVQPPSFASLGLVGFQISPHYLDPDPDSRHMGETQEERIHQFLEENDVPVVGLREGGFLRVEAGSVLLKGPVSARVFRRKQEATECPPGSRIDRSLSIDEQL